MRPTQHLAKLYPPVNRRLSYIRTIIAAAVSRGPLPHHERVIAYCVIELQNTWAQFVKYFYLSCAINARTQSGLRVVHRIPSIKTSQDALDEAVYHLNKRIKRGSPTTRGDEPDWVRLRTLVELTKHFSFSNGPTVYASLSAPTRVLEHLPRVRNFFAHKSRKTFESALSLSRVYRVAARSPSEMILSRAPGRPQCILEDWIHDLCLTVELLSHC